METGTLSRIDCATLEFLFSVGPAYYVLCMRVFQFLKFGGRKGGEVGGVGEECSAEGGVGGDRVHIDEGDS